MIGQFGTPWLVNLLLKKKTQEEEEEEEEKEEDRDYALTSCTPFIDMCIENGNSQYSHFPKEIQWQ